MLLDNINSAEEQRNSGNQRREDRRHLIYYLKVFNRVTDEVIGRVVDITPNGLLLISSDTFDSESQIPVRVELGDELFERMHGHLELDVQCRWSKKDINPNYFVNGFAFLHHNDDQKTLIKKLVEVIGFNE